VGPQACYPPDTRRIPFRRPACTAGPLSLITALAGVLAGAERNGRSSRRFLDAMPARLAAVSRAGERLPGRRFRAAGGHAAI